MDNTTIKKRITIRFLYHFYFEGSTIKKTMVAPYKWRELKYQVPDGCVINLEHELLNAYSVEYINTGFYIPEIHDCDLNWCYVDFDYHSTDKHNKRIYKIKKK